MPQQTAAEWLVYMIRADDGLYYTGITNDLSRRWQQHRTQKNGAKFFRGRRPEAVVYLETGHDRGSASRREAAIKKLARSAKLQLLRAECNVLSSATGASFLTGLIDLTDLTGLTDKISGGNDLE